MTKVSSRDAKQAISQLFPLAQTQSEITSGANYGHTDNSLSLTEKSWLNSISLFRHKNAITNVTSLNRKNVAKLMFIIILNFKDSVQLLSVYLPKVNIKPKVKHEGRTPQRKVRHDRQTN